jgi:hypothetical protein
MKTRYIIPLLLVSVFLTACTTNRWQLHQSTSSYEGPRARATRVDNTLLLDSSTGRTWLLWGAPGTDYHYEWIKLPRSSK